MSARRCLALLVLVVGCAENAVLEVEMRLPFDASDPDDRPFAVIQVVDATLFPSFEEQWAVPEESFDLRDDQACAREPSATDACNVRFHVETRRTDLRALHVRIRFCDAPGCADEDPETIPELRYRLDRPLYRGELTRWAPSLGPFVSPRGVPRVPSTQPAAGAPVSIDVCACEIAGCWTGETPPDEYGYCREPAAGTIAACTAGAEPLRHACE